MPLAAFDHVNVRTTQLQEMTAWYEAILGLKSGPRPNFPFPGAWLYLQETAVVHLVDVDGAPQAGGDITLEHFAFAATDQAAFLSHLEANDVPYEVSEVADYGITQINIHDPDGNHIHVDFRAAA